MVKWTPPRNIFEAAQRKASSLSGGSGYWARIREDLERHIEDARSLIVRPLPGQSPHVPSHGAEDGGSGTIDFEFFTFYGVQAWAGTFVASNNVIRTGSEVRVADVGIVHPPGGDEVRARFYRETLEAWAASTAIEGFVNGIFFWDGSITPLLTGRKPWSETRGRIEELADAAARSLGVEVEELAGIVSQYYRERPLSVARLLEDYGVEPSVVELPSRGKRVQAHLWVSYLEWLEKLEAVQDFLSKAIANRVMVVFVSKTSKSRSLLRKPMPDVFYLSQAADNDPTGTYGPGEPFYTRPRTRDTALDVESLNGEPEEVVAARLLPEAYRRFFVEEVGVLDFYARLAPGSSIVRLEVLYPRDALVLGDDAWAMEEAREVLSRVLAIPGRSGYPYVLLVAHREANLPREDVARAARVVGLGGVRQAREMLT